MKNEGSKCFFLVLGADVLMSEWTTKAEDGGALCFLQRVSNSLAVVLKVSFRELVSSIEPRGGVDGILFGVKWVVPCIK